MAKKKQETFMTIRTPYAPFKDGAFVPRHVNVQRLDRDQSAVLKKINSGHLRGGCVLKSGKSVVSTSDSVKFMLENAECERGTNGTNGTD